MSPDWSSSPSAIPYANPDNPQSLNLYTYVGNNPLSRRDADGHVWEWLKKLGNLFKEGEFATTSKIASERRQYLVNTGVTVVIDDKTVAPQNLSDKDAIRAYNQVADAKVLAALGIAAPVMTPWGWPGQQSYNVAKNLLEKVNTSEGTVDLRNLNGKVPTQEQAVQMIEENGGKVERIEEGHGPDSVSTHDNPHINYTTSTGAKGTIDITSVNKP